MKNLNKTFLMLCYLIFVPIIKANVKIVLTAALTEFYYDIRKLQYERALQVLDYYGCHNPYIIEAIKKEGPTFLDNYSTNVFYAQTNNTILKNHGINEAKTMLEGCDHFKFNPDDMIIKVTGRYHFIFDYFLKTVAQNNDYDAIVRMYDGYLFTLCFAMKYKYLKDMLENLNYDYLEKYYPKAMLEKETGDYIMKKYEEGTMNVLFVPVLGIQVDTQGSTSAPTVDSTFVF